MTLFSIVIPLFNKQQYIVNAVNSVLVQNVSDIEVIVVNDGSTDGSLQRLASLSDRRIRVFDQTNSGVSVARNTGIDQASGDYICFLDADDLWMPNHLSTLQQLISIDPDSIAWSTSFTEFNQTQSPREFVGSFENDAVPFRSFAQHELLQKMALRPLFYTCSITVRKNTLIAMQPCFPPSEQLGEDLDLWFRLAEKGSFLHSKANTTVFYRRNLNDSLTSRRITHQLPVFMRLAHRSLTYSRTTKRAALHLCDIHCLHIAWNCCLCGRQKEALRLILRVSPQVRWSYWLRIAVFALLPFVFLRTSLMILPRSKAI